MRAARFYGLGELRVEDVPEPEPGPGQVKIKVAYNGICGTDLHEYYDGRLMVPMDGPHPLTGVQAPVILGHEAVGVVTRTGAGVDGVKEGDLVAIEPIISCHRCPMCAAGAYNHCEQMAFHGFSSTGGGLAEYTVVDASMAHVVPPGVTPLQAAIVEPMAVAYHAVQRAAASAGDVCAIFGAGPIGLGVMFTLHAAGIETIVVEPSPVRRRTAAELGATHTVDPAAGEVSAQVHELTRGAGARACFDAAGAGSTLTDSVNSVQVGGQIVLVGVAMQPVAFLTALLFRTEATLTASSAYCDDFPAVIDGVARGDYPVTGWVDTIPLERVVEDGFEVLHAGAATKVLVAP